MDMVNFVSVRFEREIKCCDNDDYHKKNMTSSLPTNLWWNNFIEAKASEIWMERMSEGVMEMWKSILWWICECNEWDNETDIEIIFSVEMKPFSPVDAVRLRYLHIQSKYAFVSMNFFLLPMLLLLLKR